MDIQSIYEYEEGYLPTKRHRKLRWRKAEGETTLTIKEISVELAPVAFIVRNGVKFDTPVEFRLFDNRLWVPAMFGDIWVHGEGILTVEQLTDHLDRTPCYRNPKTEELVIAAKRDEADRFVIIDGVVYINEDEPRYVLMTFGLGHNHGGTALMISYHYNPNINKTAYFNALERDKAIAKAKSVAERRGDTKDIDGMGNHYIIEVIMPEAVKCNPLEDHGDGDPFLNKLNEATEHTPDLMTAALFTATVTMDELKK